MYYGENAFELYIYIYMTSISKEDIIRLEDQCRRLKDKFPDKCAIFVQTNNNIKVNKNKFLVPLSSTFESFVVALKKNIQHDPSIDLQLDIFVNQVSSIKDDVIFSSIFDSYAMRDKENIPLYLYVNYKKKQPAETLVSTASWLTLGLW
jgi:hypothetical protein